MYATSFGCRVLLCLGALCAIAGAAPLAHAAGREPRSTESGGGPAAAALEMDLEPSTTAASHASCDEECDREVSPSAIGPTALPAFFSVPRSVMRRGIWALAQTGYSFVEGHEAVPGAHHSSVSRLALGAVPLAGLQVGASMELRHHQHTAPIVDTGTWLETRGDIRWGLPLSPALNAGALAVVHARPVQSGGRFVPEAGLFAHLRPRGLRQQYGLRFGYRRGDGAQAAQEAARYRESDRLTARSSEFDALMWALSGEHRFGKSRLVAEVSGEVLIGAEAPSLLHHPARLSVGYRRPLSERWGFYGAAHGGLSTRAGALETDLIYPIEPRVSVDFGLAYALMPAPKAQLAEPEPGSVRVDVRADGFGVSDARVELRRGKERIVLARQRLGVYEAAAVAPGSGELWVIAKRLKPYSRRVEVLSGSSLDFQVQMEPEPIQSRISGWVRSSTGEALSASVRVIELGLTLRTDEAGRFDTEAPPGTYTLVLQATGHLQERRSVEVGGEVLLINVQLRRQEP